MLPSSRLGINVARVQNGRRRIRRMARSLLRQVLVIEDDLETAEQVADCLRMNAYSVDLAENGEEGLNRALAADYLVMTVDRLLPRIDGLEVIRQLRGRGISTPALILSALGEVDDRVRGLRSGGDDYLVIRFERDAGPRRCPCASQRYRSQRDDA